VTASFPDQDRKASLIHLEDMKISKVEYFADSDVLAERMEKMPKGD
jgi:ketosteroid isomerase-like protein